MHKKYCHYYVVLKEGTGKEKNKKRQRRHLTELEKIQRHPTHIRNSLSWWWKSYSTKLVQSKLLIFLQMCELLVFLRVYLPRADWEILSPPSSYASNQGEKMHWPQHRKRVRLEYFRGLMGNGAKRAECTLGKRLNLFSNSTSVRCSQANIVPRAFSRPK